MSKTCCCCNCCFCCCDKENYEPVPKPPIVTRQTPAKRPPDSEFPSGTSVNPEWPVDILPKQPTVEDYLTPTINEDLYEQEYEDFSFPPKVKGCTDPLATNYNPNAKISDGSCVYPVPGCMDPLATNYNPNATVNNGSCVYTPPPYIPQGCGPQWSTEHTSVTGNSGQTNPASVTPPSIAERMRKTTVFSQSITTVDDQGPHPLWMSQSDWDAMYWDGIPLADPYGKTPTQICAWMFKNRAMKGLKQHYEFIQPFSDPTNPTIAEIDCWNLEVIRHFRKLIGVTTPIEPDARLYLAAAWAEERRQTFYWNDAYPGTFNSAYGPCRYESGGTTTIGSNAHCGATFVPSFADQAPYLTQYPGLQPFNTLGGGAEAVGTMNTDLPWAIKLTSALQNWVCTEGLTGHTGPFVTRTKVGMAFWSWKYANPSNTTLRIKWLG